jgi:hypothetical protein
MNWTHFYYLLMARRRWSSSRVALTSFAGKKEKHLEGPVQGKQLTASWDSVDAYEAPET